MVPSVKKMSGKIGHEFPSFFVVPCTCPVQDAWMFHCEAASLDWIQHGTFAENKTQKKHERISFFSGAMNHCNAGGKASLTARRQV